MVSAGNKSKRLSSVNHTAKTIRHHQFFIFNNYIFVPTFQWTSSECLTNVTITVKFDVRSVFGDLQTAKTELFARTVHG